MITYKTLEDNNGFRVEIKENASLTVNYSVINVEN